VGSQDPEDCYLRQAQAKISENSISVNKLGLMVCTCNPSYVGGLQSEANLRQNYETLSEKIKQKKKRNMGVLIKW
jgi:hypothetical protein